MSYTSVNIETDNEVATPQFLTSSVVPYTEFGTPLLNSAGLYLLGDDQASTFICEVTPPLPVTNYPPEDNSEAEEIVDVSSSSDGSIYVLLQLHHFSLYCDDYVISQRVVKFDLPEEPDPVVTIKKVGATKRARFT
jgi:hypothetical protein